MAHSLSLQGTLTAEGAGMNSMGCGFIPPKLINPSLEMSKQRNNYLKVPKMNGRKQT